MKYRLKLLMFLVLALGLLVPSLVQAGAVIPGVFGANTLAGNDDGSTGLVGIGFSVNYFGATYTDLYVNNNGNVTFTGPQSVYTPFGLTTSGIPPIIAPFFADVDTRVGNTLTYGTGSYGGHSAFGVNWLDVGYFGEHTDKLNTFQLVLIDRSDVAAGDFDIMFNYDQIQWETGDASGGSGGLGGDSAHVGYSNGSGVAGTNYEFTGSGINGAFLDDGPNALISDSNVGLPGRYVFEVRSGDVNPVVPLPPTVLLMGSGILGLAGLGFWRKRS
ncbi:MAG: nidogen-like domain-containing protein [Desulfobaccales bacterium]